MDNLSLQAQLHIHTGLRLQFLGDDTIRFFEKQKPAYTSLFAIHFHRLTEKESAAWRQLIDALNASDDVL